MRRPHFGQVCSGSMANYFPFFRGKRKWLFELTTNVSLFSRPAKTRAIGGLTFVGDAGLMLLRSDAW